MEAFYLGWIVHLQVRFHPALLIGPALKILVRMIGASQTLAIVSRTLAIDFLHGSMADKIIVVFSATRSI